MALSSSESELLTQTCENMNVAANTCREVLEMLRNLGNTGVVDIATHNNAETAHANAKNLAKTDSYGSITVGTYGYWPSYSNYYPCTIDRTGAQLNRIVESKTGTSPNQFKDQYFYSVTDGDGHLISINELDSTLDALRIVAWGQFANSKQVNGTLSYFIGSWAEEPFTADASYWTFGTAGGGSSWTYRVVFTHNTIAPVVHGGLALGRSNKAFDTAYLVTAATVTSDRREKSGVAALDAKALDFVRALRPVQYTVKNGRQNILETDGDGNATNIEVVPGTRRHWGLIAQEVQEALVSAGYDPSDCAVWSLSDKNDPDSKQALRYEELIAPMIKVIQSQQERIEALERKVA